MSIQNSNTNDLTAQNVIDQLEAMTPAQLAEWNEAEGWAEYMFTPTMDEINAWLQRRAVAAAWARGDIGRALWLQENG